MKIRIGGVPEYFNLPIRLAIESGGFDEQGLHVEWVEYLQGTGRMANDLANGSLDLAVLLTEGAIKAIYEGNPSRIIKTHVNSPLIWGIHSPADSTTLPLEEALKETIAISRYGSGSHLMAVHLALQLGVPVENLDFLVVDDIEGARNAFKNNKAHLFFWEKYTTKPYVDNGEFLRVEEHPSPWPPFVIVASDHMVSFYEEELRQFLSIVNKYVKQTRSMEDLPDVIARRYALKREDVSILLAELKWNDGFDVPISFEEEVLNTFQSAKILGSERRSELFFKW